MTDRLHSFTLGDVVRENARWLPDTEAIVCGDDRLTYPEIDARTTKLANVLRDLGVEPGDRVAWLGLNCHRLFEFIFACSKAGAVAAPLNWRLSSAETAAILEDIRPKVIIGSSRPEFDEVNANARAVLPSAGWLSYDDGSYEAALENASSVDPAQDDDDEAGVLIIMTAAFAGKPKAAVLTSRGIVQQDLMLGAVGGVKPMTETYLSSGPMFHIGVLLKAFALFHWGGLNVMIPRVDAEEVCRLIDREHCTSAFVFGPTIKEMAELNADGRYDLHSLNDVLGGTPPPELDEAWYSMTSCPRPGSQPRGAVGYGTSETVGMITYEGRLPVGTGTFGRPGPAMAVRIVDPDGAEVPVGQIGEVVARGPQVMVGYLGLEPMDPQGWRWTGDLGRREADGSFTFLGPNQEMIKTGMENVYPVEVENALKEHPAVKDACVIGVPDPVWGHSVRAVVELADGGPVEPDELIEFVRDRIASYKKPKSVVIVDVLPRSGPFVDRPAVKGKYGEGETWQ
jgi:acyl-CoA synthetase (AMP-forming)/AMP-acid ligase II